MPSNKVLEMKKTRVKEMSDKFKNAKSIIIADYRGINVEDDTKLRKEFREANIEYRVVKNSIANFAAKDNGYDDLEKYFVGPTAIAISNEDPVAPAKLLSKHAKTIKAIEIKAGVVEGNIISLQEVKALADLPSKEELIAKVLGSLNAPIYGLANVLNGNIRGLAVALNAIAEKKQGEEAS